MLAEVQRIERIRRFALVIVVLLLTGTAAADPAADAAFARGREMLKVGKYAEACDAFEESHRLKPRIDAQFNIALCSEQLGKLATALALYRELAQTLDTPARRAKSAELAAQLEPRVPRLRIIVGEARKRTRRPPPELAVRVNGVRVTNYDDLPIDLGSNPVAAIAPGFLDWSGQVSAAEEGKVVTITIDLERDPEAIRTDGEEGGTEEPDPPPGGDDRKPVAPPGSSNQKAYAVVTLALGGLALGGGITYGVLARSAWSDARIACGGDTVCDASELALGTRYRDQAHQRGNISTALFIAGGVAVTAGIVLWATAPKARKSVAIAPSASASSAGLLVFGRF